MTTKRHTATIHAKLVEQDETIRRLERVIANIGNDREVVHKRALAAENQLYAANERAERAERQVSDLRLTVDLLARAIAVQAGARFAAVGAPRAVGS